jgi:antitoxin component of MazEF toxin-antitoxin module
MLTWEGKVEREEITILSLASSKGRSLRTTVPMSIVKHLKLKEKDKLKWEIKPKDNEFLIIVRPLRRKGEKDQK